MVPFDRPHVVSLLAPLAPVAQLTTDNRALSWDRFTGQFIASIVYTALGLVFFALSFWIITRFCPFSVRKEIEEDQNTSLAILIGSVIIGIAIIVAAAIHGG
jgi:putative membrane protein